MAKVRVYELAKELGVESKTVLSMLKDMGEFVRSASSTVEAPVERRLKEKLASEPPPPPKKTQQRKRAAAKARRGGAEKQPAPAPVEVAAEAPAVTPPSRARASAHRQSARRAASSAAADAGSASRRATGTGPSRACRPDWRDARRPAPRPRPGSTGGLPGAPAARRPGTPRPGNNPFSSSQGMGQPRRAASRRGRRSTGGTASACRPRSVSPGRPPRSCRECHGPTRR